MTLVSPNRSLFACLRLAIAAISAPARARSSYRLSALGIVLLAGSQLCFAQKDAGAIAGTAHDASGALMADVTIVATDVDHGAVVTVTSNASGQYVVAPLKVGRYTINARKSGFTSVVSTPITLQVQQRVVFDVTLTVGAVNQSVTVTDSTAQLQTEPPISARSSTAVKSPIFRSTAATSPS